MTKCFVTVLRFSCGILLFSSLLSLPPRQSLIEIALFQTVTLPLKHIGIFLGAGINKPHFPLKLCFFSSCYHSIEGVPSHKKGFCLVSWRSWVQILITAYLLVGVFPWEPCALGSPWSRCYCIVMDVSYREEAGGFKCSLFMSPAQNQLLNFEIKFKFV